MCIGLGVDFVLVSINNKVSVLPLICPQEVDGTEFIVSFIVKAPLVSGSLGSICCIHFLFSSLKLFPFCLHREASDTKDAFSLDFLYISSPWYWPSSHF